MTNMPNVKPISTYYLTDIHKYKSYLPTAFDESLSLLEKVNKVIEQMNAIGKISNEITNQWNGLLDWILTQGIESTVNKKLDEMISDGTLSDIINVQIFDDLNIKIDGKLSKVLFDEILPTLQHIENLHYISTGNNPTIDKTGSRDVTLAFQKYFDELKDGQTLVIAPGEYLVSKNSFLTGFPNGDQPSLLITGKKNVTIIGNGATFKTETHGQGILEIQKSENVIIEGIKFVGRGIFPAIDSVTGYGEKGTATGGYDTSGFWGYRKNNSYDTRERINPSTNQKYGTFGGGFIGNVAIGLLIHNGNKRVTIRNCESTGFNYSGFQVGHLGDYLPTPINPGINYNISYEGCYSHDNYNSNYYSMDVELLSYDNCISEKSGHPGATNEHTYVDPGYGFGMGGSDYAVSKNVTINNCKSLFDNRKGIDGHRGIGLIATNNYIEGAKITGIFYKTTNQTQRTYEYDISNNKIVNVGSGKNPSAGIEIGGVRGANYSELNALARGKVNHNLLINCFGVYGLIETGTVKNLEIIGNQIDEIMPVDSRGNKDAKPVGIYVGYSLVEEPSYLVTVKDNIINGSGYVDLIGGMNIRNIQEGIISGNLVKIKHDFVKYGIQVMDTIHGKITDNVVVLGIKGIPIIELRNTMLVTGNTSKGGQVASSGTALSMKRISFKLNVTNGEKLITWFEGEEHIRSIENLATRGMRINLSNVQVGTYPLVNVIPGGRTILSTIDTPVKYYHVLATGWDNIQLGMMTGKEGIGVQGTDIEYDTLYNGSAIFTIII